MCSFRAGMTLATFVAAPLIIKLHVVAVAAAVVITR
jgi:hypothetical protein